MSSSYNVNCCELSCSWPLQFFNINWWLYEMVWSVLRYANYTIKTHWKAVAARAEPQTSLAELTMLPNPCSTERAHLCPGHHFLEASVLVRIPSDHHRFSSQVRLAVQEKFMCILSTDRKPPLSNRLNVNFLSTRLQADEFHDHYHALTKKTSQKRRRVMASWQASASGGRRYGWSDTRVNRKSCEYWS